MKVSRLSRNSAVFMLAFGFWVFTVQQQVQQIGHTLPGRGRCVPRPHHRRSRFIWLTAPADIIRPGAWHPIGKTKDIEQRDFARLADIVVDRIMHAARRQNCHRRKRSRSAITSKVVRTMSSAMSTARGPAAVIRSQLRSAAAVMIGPRFITLRCENTGAAVRRCQRQCAPFGDEQRVADGRAQQVLGDQRFGIIIQLPEASGGSPRGPSPCASVCRCAPTPWVAAWRYRE